MWKKAFWVGQAILPAAGFEPASEVWPFAPMNRCSGRAADTRACCAETHLGAAFVGHASFSLSSRAQLDRGRTFRPPFRYAANFSDFVARCLRNTNPEKCPLAQ